MPPGLEPGLPPWKGDVLTVQTMAPKKDMRITLILCHLLVDKSTSMELQDLKGHAIQSYSDTADFS